MDVNDRNFRKALGSFATGVTVVTARRADGEPVGLTVNAFSSISLEPPLVMVCLGNGTRDLDAYTEQGHFAVHILRDSQRDVSIAFASRNPEKWTEVAWAPGYADLPMVQDTLAAIGCDVQAIHEAGDHKIIIGEVKRLEVATGGQPLLYFRGNYMQAGCQV